MKNFKFRPTNYNLLIERNEIEEKTAGGIIIPVTENQEKPSEGKILAVGNKVEDYEVGQHVFFGKYSGNEIEVRGQQFFTVPESDIIGVLEENEDDDVDENGGTL